MSVASTQSSAARRSRRTARGLAATGVVALAVATLAAPAAALTVDSVSLERAKVSGDVFPRDLAVGPGGQVRLLLERWGDRGVRAEQREVVVGAEGLVGDPLPLLRPLASQGSFTLGALTERGAVVTFRSNRPPHPKLRAVIWEDGKPVGPARTVSDPSHSFRGGYTTASANGAAAVSFSQHLGKGVWEQRIAVRPAGASRFLPAVSASPTDQPDRRRHDGVVLSDTYWGPNGDGLMLWSASPEGDDPSVIRRIRRDGSLGPAVKLPRAIQYPIDGFSAIEIAPDGTIVLVDRSTTYGPWVDDGGDGEHQQITSRAEVITIPAGSDTPSAPVLLREVTGWNDRVDELFVGAGAGPDGQVMVAVGGGEQRIELFEGSLDPASLKSVASFPSLERATFTNIHVVHTADGGAAAFWGGETVGSMRGPGGAWSAPAYLMPKGGWGYSVLEQPRALPDGGVAAIIRRSVDEDDDGPDSEAGAFVVRIHR